MKRISLICAVLLIFNCQVGAKGLKGPETSPQQNGIPDYLMHTAASYSNGLLQIEIPFWGDPLVRPIGIGFTGLWFAGGIKPGNLLGWISYCDPEGEIILSGPLRSLNGFDWIWYADYMPDRVEIGGPHLPIAKPLSPGYSLQALDLVLGATHPDGTMKFRFHGEMFTEFHETPLTVRVRQGTQDVLIPLSTGFRQFVNYIAFGSVASLIVNQEIAVSNLGSDPCMLDIDLFNRDGSSWTQLHLTVEGDSTVRAPLIDLYQEQTQSSEVPPLTLGTAMVTAVTESGAPDPASRLALGTIYQILQAAETQTSPQNVPTQDTVFLSEAGLAVPEPSLYNIIPVRKTSDGEDTGVAIANPEVKWGASFTMRLLDENQSQVATSEGLLAARSGDSKFFLEYFTGLTGITDFTGSLQIHSGVALGAIALNTLNGYVQSSLPAGTEKP